jgi:hypothetical protein
MCRLVHDVAQGYEVGDATILADGSVIDLIASRVWAGAADVVDGPPRRLTREARTSEESARGGSVSVIERAAARLLVAFRLQA